MKRLIFIIVLIGSASLLSACSLHLGLSSLLNPGSTANGTPTKHVKATHTPPAPNSISVTQKGFIPDSLTVKVGTTVTWTNAGSTAQSVTSDAAGMFDSGPLNTGAVFTFTFAQPGTFTYHSANTTTLTGKIIVTP